MATTDHRRVRPVAAAWLVAIVLASTISGPLSAAATVPTAGQSAGGEAAALPLAGIVVAVDPGHNGGNASHPSRIARRVWIGNRWKACNTVGTATRKGYPEHRFAYAVALRVKARLEALGATVRLTRSSDTGVGPCVDARGRFGAKVHAALTISIHADGSALAHRGFFVMKPGRVPGYTVDILARSARLALAMRGGLLSAGLPIANYYARHGIVSRTDLGTLNMSDVPVVMVELGNMKNAGDAARMTSATGRDRYAAGLVAGIRRYLGR
jgi:N-acetylmuramoyl-L-alanine amidase